MPDARLFVPGDGWFLVPAGVPCWGRTVMHTPDGATYTNVAPPEPPAPDLRTVGDRVVEHEDRIRYLETMVHRLLNPGEQEGE